MTRLTAAHSSFTAMSNANLPRSESTLSISSTLTWALSSTAALAPQYIRIMNTYLDSSSVHASGRLNTKRNSTWRKHTTIRIVNRKTIR